MIQERTEIILTGAVYSSSVAEPCYNSETLLMQWSIALLRLFWRQRQQETLGTSIVAV